MGSPPSSSGRNQYWRADNSQGIQRCLANCAACPSRSTASGRPTSPGALPGDGDGEPASDPLKPTMIGHM